MSVLEVGTNAQYKTIASAVAASHDGDVIQVQAGTYTNDFAEITTKVTLEGVGGMVNMVATGSISNGKAILITDTDVTIDHFAFSGASVNDGNGAGIRFQSGNLTITNSYFHDNQDGLLSAADPNGTITIRNSEFSHNGTGNGTTHNLYVGDIKALTVDNSYFHDAVVGHEIKSRAETTTITNSRIEDGPNGTGSYEIDLPNGGNATITGNVIEKGPNAQNANMIAFGEEGGVHANSALTVSGNTFLNDTNASNVAALNNATSVAASLLNNSTYRIAPGQLIRGTGTASGTTALSSEPALDTSTPIAAASSGGAGSSSGGGSGSGSSGGGSGSGTTTTPVSTDGLVLFVSEDAYQGDAQYTISVDGQLVGGTRTATASHGAGQTQAVSVGTLAPGQHTIGVTFLNDRYDGSSSTDRNLYVDSAALDGQTVPGGSETLQSAGTQSFNLQVPGASTPPVTTPPVTTPTPPTASNGLVLSVSEDAYQGNAQYTVSVDGQLVGGTRIATASHGAGQTESVPVGVTLSPGQHTVTVTFLNDLYNGSPDTDRNLYVDGATLDGQAVAGSAEALLSAGPQSFNLQVGPTPPASTPPSSTPPATTTPTQPASTDGLVLFVSEDAYQGDAQYTISVDGQTVGGTRTATASHGAGQTQAVSVGTLAPGQHTIGVTFLNDRYDGSSSTDRNLYVDGATLNGQAIGGSTEALLSAGTQSFNVRSAAAPTSTLVLNLAEDAWQGDAQVQVSVDGNDQGTYTVTASHAAGQSQAVTITGIAESFAAHDIAVSFLNDAYGGTSSTDRNLYLNSMQLDGAAVPGSAAAFLSAGTQHFSATAPANWSG